MNTFEFVTRVLFSVPYQRMRQTYGLTVMCDYSLCRFSVSTVEQECRLILVAGQMLDDLQFLPIVSDIRICFNPVLAILAERNGT